MDQTNGDEIYLTTRGAFQVSGVAGTGSDVLLCQPGTLGNATQCTFSLWFDGSAEGVSAVIDGLTLAGPPDLLAQTTAVITLSNAPQRRR